MNEFDDKLIKLLSQYQAEIFEFGGLSDPKTPVMPDLVLMAVEEMLGIKSGGYPHLPSGSNRPRAASQLSMG